MADQPVEVSIKRVKVKERDDVGEKKFEAKEYNPEVPIQKGNVVTIAVEAGSGADKRKFELKGIVIDDPSRRSNPRFIITEMKDVGSGEVTKLAEADSTEVNNPGLVLRETDLTGIKTKDFTRTSEELLKLAFTQDQDEHKNPFQEVFKKPAIKKVDKNPEDKNASLGKPQDSLGVLLASVVEKLSEVMSGISNTSNSFSVASLGELPPPTGSKPMPTNQTGRSSKA